MRSSGCAAVDSQRRGRKMLIDSAHIIELGKKLAILRTCAVQSDCWFVGDDGVEGLPDTLS